MHCSVKKNLSGYIIAAVVVLLLALAAVAIVACAGPVGPTGPAGPTGPTGPAGPPGTAATGVSLAAAIQPEGCTACHKDGGAKHQESYNDLYQDGVIKVTNLTYAFSSSPDTIKITFKITKNGEPFNAIDADSKAINFVPYTGKSFEEPARVSLLGTLTYDSASGITTSTLVEKAPGTSGYVDVTDVGKVNGLIVVYGRDETVGTLPGTRVTQNRYPFAALLETGSGVDYVSTANVAGCEKCHTVPYLKHSYIYGQVNHDATTDFYTCKACHLDNGAGGHYEWQLLVDDPAFAVNYLEHGANMTAEQKAKYAYKTTLMNDVHMSHAMEFPYPQSMSNCVTCHEGKLNKILTDANFKVATCKSCHPVDGSKQYGTDKLALKTIMPSAIHGSMDLNTVDCSSCHAAGKGASVFSKIHTGYDKAIYTSTGQKYSQAITVSIDSASFANNKLTIKFSATEKPDIAGLDVAAIKPTVLVGLYGYDTKDYIIGPHERLTDDNGDKVIDSKDSRALEYVVGAKHPRFTTVSAAGGKWEVTADLSTWANLVADNTTKRVEIGVMPALTNADNTTLALNAPSRTFDLKANAFNDKFYSPIVKVADGCNTCHDALATTFHTADRGGNIVICRLCHTPKAGGSHLEVQSRSIDSYVHAIHAGQGFDIGDINFADPVAALHYEDHIAFPFPRHANTDCESCHVTGKYNVPDQSKSLPGILSATDPVEGIDRSISSIPSYVTGPASRACGGCHRANLVNEDDANGLVSFLQHTRQGGYLIPEGTEGQSASAILDKVIQVIMGFFK